MKIKLLQLNCEGGRFFTEIIEYIKAHDFDIIQLQEVSGGTLCRYGHKDVFLELLNNLNYRGELTKTMHGKDEANYFGNATLFKSTFVLNSKQVIWLKPFMQLDELPKDKFDELPRNCLHLELGIDNQKLNLINAHLAWGATPFDEEYKILQASILQEYIKKVDKPYILSGDFNVTPDTEIVKRFDLVARNLTSEYHISNTLNPITHRVRSLFPAGLAVDYIYTSHNLEVKTFEVITQTLSDHLGLYIEIEL